MHVGISHGVKRQKKDSRRKPSRRIYYEIYGLHVRGRNKLSGQKRGYFTNSFSRFLLFLNKSSTLRHLNCPSWKGSVIISDGSLDCQRSSDIVLLVLLVFSKVIWIYKGIMIYNVQLTKGAIIQCLCWFLGNWLLGNEWETNQTSTAWYYTLLRAKIIFSSIDLISTEVILLRGN